MLSGQAEYVEQVRSLAGLLQTLGFDVEQRVSILPTIGGPPFGVVQHHRPFIYHLRDGRREVVNQVVMGEALFLLAEHDGMYLCHAPDGYVGWIDAAAVAQRGRARCT